MCPHTNGSRHPSLPGAGCDVEAAGFGNRVNKDDSQGYAWAGKPVEKGVIEIAVTSKPLTEEEQRNLLSE